MILGNIGVRMSVLGGTQSLQLLQNLQNQIQGMGDVASKAGRGLLTIGGTLTAVTSPLLLLGKVGVSSFMEFNKNMMNTQSIAKMSASDLEMFKNKILDISAQLGSSPTDLSDAFYDIASSGFFGAEGLEIMTASAQMAKAGLSTTKDSVKGLTSVLNAYGLSASEANDVSDIMFKTVERGVVTLPELTASLKNALPSASALGVPFEVLASAIATVTKKSETAKTGLTGVNMLMLSLLNGTDGLNTLFSDFGGSAKAMESIGFVEVLKRIKEHTGNVGSEIAKLGLGVDGVKALFELNSGDMFAKDLEDIADKSKRAGATVGALAIQSESIVSVIGKVTNGITVLGTKMISVLEKPIIKPILDGLKYVIDLLNRVSKPVLFIISIVGGIITAIGPIIATMGLLGLSIGAIVTGAVALFTALSAVFTFLASSLPVILPILLIVPVAIVSIGVAIASLVLIIAQLTGGLDKWKERISFLFSKEGVMAVKQWAIDTAKVLFEWLVFLLNIANKGFIIWKNFYTGIAKLGQVVVGNIIEYFKFFPENLVKTFNRAIELSIVFSITFIKLLKNIPNAFLAEMKGIWNIYTTYLSMMVEGAGIAFKRIQNVFVLFAGFVRDIVGIISEYIYTGIFDPEKLNMSKLIKATMDSVIVLGKGVSKEIAGAFTDVGGLTEKTASSMKQIINDTAKGMVPPEILDDFMGMVNSLPAMELQGDFTSLKDTLDKIIEETEGELGGELWGDKLKNMLSGLMQNVPEGDKKADGDEASEEVKKGEALMKKPQYASAVQKGSQEAYHILVSGRNVVEKKIEANTKKTEENTKNINNSVKTLITKTDEVRYAIVGSGTDIELMEI
jgi:TP901 family phage tail tape measure protein